MQDGQGQRTKITPTVVLMNVDFLWSYFLPHYSNVVPFLAPLSALQEHGGPTWHAFDVQLDTL